MIASHPHSDHIGGLVDVLEDAAVSSDLTVSMVLLPEIPDKDVPTTRVYEAFLDGIEDNHIDPTFVSEKQTLNLGGAQHNALGHDDADVAAQGQAHGAQCQEAGDGGWTRSNIT